MNNTNETRTIIAIVLCVVFYFAYTKYLEQKYPGLNNPAQVEQAAAPDASTTTATQSTSGDASQPESSIKTSPQTQVALLSPEQLTFENNETIYQFDQSSGGLASVLLKNYRADKNPKNAAPMQLLDAPLYVRGTTVAKPAQISGPFAAERQDNTLRFALQDSAWAIVQTYKIPTSGYTVDLDVSFTNTGATAAELDAGLLMAEALKLPQKSGSSFLPGVVGEQYNLIASVDGSLQKTLAKDFCDDESKTEALSANAAEVDFVGFDRHYFLSALIVEKPKFNFSIQKRGLTSSQATCDLLVHAFQAQGQVQPGQSLNMQYKMYFGPKDVGVLVANDPKLKQSVDLGWFGIVAHPLLVVLKIFYGFLHNYGLAIILLTVLLKVAFYPLTRAAAVSMKKMQKLQPEMQKIRERNKDNPQAQQKELMQFMAAHKINPAKGCLPILPQIPVFIAFYNVLSQSIELRHAPFFGWIQDLSAQDPFYISPVLLGVGMFVQQKLTPNPSMDKTQEKIMLMLPIIFTAMMLSLPAGMVIYMITNTVVSIAQQQWLNRRLK